MGLTSHLNTFERQVVRPTSPWIKSLERWEILQSKKKLQMSRWFASDFLTPNGGPEYCGGSKAQNSSANDGEHKG